MNNTEQKPTAKAIRAVLVGAGGRTSLYAEYAKLHPERLEIVAVVDPDPIRRKRLGDDHSVTDSHRYQSIDELLAAGRLGDAAINGTMDDLHIPTSIPLLESGYHLLLEKPIGVSLQEVELLNEAAQRTKRHVMICHVLRYAPFYSEIRRRIAEGAIGDIINIQTAEHVSYHHMATAFVRGKWNNKEKCGSSMLLAKCCHDLDLLTWFKSGVAPQQVACYGGRTVFTAEKAPEGAGTRCLVDCAVEHLCPYSARKQYIDRDLWGVYVWHSIEHLGTDPTLEQKLESLRTDNPYGRCVWHSDNNVVDHQSVVIEFEDGSTATHNLVGGTARPCRNLHIVGTKGEISGTMEDGCYFIRRPDLDAPELFAEEKVVLNVTGDMHGGGDLRLVEDFVRVLQGERPSLSTTVLSDSINGHRIGFAADQAMENKISVEL